MPGDDLTPPPEPKRLTNRDRVPAKKPATARTVAQPSELKVSAQEKTPAVRSVVEQKLTSGLALTRADLGSGRGLQYEWEFFVDQLFRQLADVGSSVPQSLVFVQNAPAAVWTINHFLGTKPNVLVVDGAGQELLAEVHYPDDVKVVVIHGQPYSGTVYLRA